MRFSGARRLVPVTIGAGSAARSSLPFGVSGIASSATMAAGTMYSGISAASDARSAQTSIVAPARGTTYATSRSCAGPSCRTTACACATDGSHASRAAISPSSTRKPRTFTCSSARPMKSSPPSARHRATSPVRYMRVPGGPNGSAMKRCAVSDGRRR